MKKIVSAADLGGAPFTKQDLREVFNDEIWDAIEALLAPFNSDTEGIIVSGCVFTNNAGNFDMTAGIVYLNGEFMRISAVTNQSYTKYIAPATPTSDSRVFSDTTSHAVTQTKTAGIVGSAPGGGQYITIDNLTGADDRRWQSGSRGSDRVHEFVSTFFWDLNANSTFQITLPTSLISSRQKVASISLKISADSGDQVYFPALAYDASISGDAIGVKIDTFSGVAKIQFTRVASSIWDTASFDTLNPNCIAIIRYID